jgi:hypothetical protein
MTKETVKNYIEKYYVPGSHEDIKVGEIWENRYRVNVWTYNPPKIKASFFVRVENNEVTYCNPPLGLSV